MEGISVRELLQRTYSGLEKKFEHTKVVFQEPAFAKIADDSDWHRTREGFMKYEEANLFRFNGNTWAVTRGEAYGSYPARPYDSDLTAILFQTEGKSKKEIQEELHSEIRSSIFFSNSLIYGMRDGSLAVNEKSPLGKKVLEALKNDVSNHVAKKQEIDTRFITTDLRYLCKQPTMYKPEFAEYLTKTIEKILKEVEVGKNDTKTCITGVS